LRDAIRHFTENGYTRNGGSSMTLSSADLAGSCSMTVGCRAAEGNA
jgi:hypothetical protein